MGLFSKDDPVAVNMDDADAIRAHVDDRMSQTTFRARNNIGEAAEVIVLTLREQTLRLEQAIREMGAGGG